MRRPLPVTVVTGFLGAGKTTFLKRLLRAPHGLRIGLVLNEFGEAGIDPPPGTEQTYLELAEGCACCLRNPDLVQAMHELSERGDLDRVVLETAGLADPLPIAWTLEKPELIDAVRLDAIVTIVDPLNAPQTRTDEWESQIRCADIVVLSKSDLATPDSIAHVRSLVREVSPHARFVEPGADLPLEALLDLDVATPRATGLGDRHAAHSDFRAATIATRAAVDLDRLEELLEELPAEIFRAKGVVRTDDGWAEFHVVGNRLVVDAHAAPPPHGETRIAAFGPGLTHERLLALVQPAMLDSVG